MDQMFICLYELKNESVIVEKGSYDKKAFAQSSKTVLHPIEELIKTIETLMNDDNKGMLLTIKKDLTDIKDRFSYFVASWSPR